MRKASGASSRRLVLGLLILCAGLLGEECFTGDFLAGVVVIGNPDERCVALGGVFPLGLDFVPPSMMGETSSRIWVADRDTE